MGMNFLTMTTSKLGPQANAKTRRPSVTLASAILLLGSIASLLLPAALTAQVYEDLADQVHFDPPDAFQILPQAQNRKTDYYAIGDLTLYYWTDIYTETACLHGQEPFNAGPFRLGPSAPSLGDFNGDGLEDLAIFFTAIKGGEGAALYPVFFLSNGDGKLEMAPLDSLFTHGPPPKLQSPYRSQVADFNGDGFDDILVGDNGIGAWDCEAQYTYTDPQPMYLFLSDGEGGLIDATRQIEGQENGDVPDDHIGSRHALAVGDIDGDVQDFYVNNWLFLNDGTGHFINASDLLPPLPHPWEIVQAAAMGDLDGDGKDDVAVFRFLDNVEPYQNSHVLLSKGAQSIAEYRWADLPDGHFDQYNTNFNYAVIADFDIDGRNDIMVMQTRGRPYYEGLYRQLLINKGDGVFEEERFRIVGDDGDQNGVHGEGFTRLADVNGDGFLDTIDMGGGTNDLIPDSGPRLRAATVLINGGDGYHYAMPEDEIPFLVYTDLAQFKYEYRVPQRYSMLLPIQLDEDPLPEFVSAFEAYQIPDNPGEKPKEAHYFLYTIDALEPYNPAVLPPTPRLSVSTSQLDFASKADQNPPPQDFDILSAGGAGDLDWTATVFSDGDWLHIAKPTGTTWTALDVSVSPTGLEPGVHEGSIKIEADGGANSPQTVTVRYTVAAPELSVSTNHLEFESVVIGQDPEPLEVEVLSDTAPLDWTATVSPQADWLHLVMSSGTTGTSLQVAVFSAGLSPGVYEGSISIEAAGAANSPQIVTVRYTVGGVPQFTEASFANAASYATDRFAEQMWVALFGQNLAADLLVPDGELPTELGGTRLFVTDSQGVRRPAKLQFVHPERINFLIPAGTANGPAEVEVINHLGERNSAVIPIENVAPGLFSANSDGLGPAAATYVRIDADGTRTEGLTFNATDPPGQRTHFRIRRSQQLYFSFFGTGFRNYSTVRVVISGEEDYIPIINVSAHAIYDGLDQIVVGPFPEGGASGVFEFWFFFDEVRTNTVEVWIDPENP